MSAEATGLQLTIEAAADLEKGLSVAIGQLRSSAAQMQQQIDGVANANKRGEAATKGWMETLRAYRTEQVQQGRQARFLVDEIASIVPVSKDAQGALQGLAGVFVEGLSGGLGIGLAIEAVKALVGYFALADAAANRLREQQVQAIEASLKRSRDVLVEQTRELEKQRLIKAGMTSEAAEAKLTSRDAKGTRDEAQGRYLAYAADDRALTERRNELQRQLDELMPSVIGGDTSALAAAASIRAEIYRVNAIAAQLTPMLEAARAAWDNFAGAADAATEAAKLATRTIASIPIRPATPSSPKVQDFDPTVEVGGRTMTRSELGNIRKTPTLPTSEIVPSFDGAEARAAQDQIEKAFQEAASRRAREHAKLVAEWQELGQLGTNVAEALGGAMAAAFTQGRKGVLQFGATLLDQVAASIQAKALEAAATAAAANAWNPFVAAAASVAALSFVRGLAAQLPGRADGGSVSGGQPYLVGERGPEVFTPSTSGGITPNHALGGTTVYMTVNALDAASFRRSGRTLRRELVNVLNGARRDGISG